MTRQPLPGATEALLYLRNNGPRRALVKLMSRHLIGRQRWYLTREDLTRYSGVPVPSIPYRLRFARPLDLPRMDEFRRRMTAASLRAWLERQYFFYIALTLSGEPVSYRCLSTRPHPAVAGYMPLRPDQLFMVDEFTVPAYRRRGLTRALAVAMAPLLLTHGFREVLGLHRLDNENTIMAIRAKGIPTVGTVVRTRFLWRSSLELAG
jgi:hypothetical protein